MRGLAAAARGLLLLLGFLGVAFAATFPAFTGPPESVVGGFQGPDLVGTAWTWWWTSFALWQGLDPTRCAWTFFPAGLYPVASFNLVDAFLVAPLYWGFDPIRAYNLGNVWLLSLTGLSGYALGRMAGARRGPAVVAGILLMCCPYVLGETWTGRPGQAFLAFVALGLGCWVRLLRGGGWGWVAAAAASTTLAFLEYWYYGLFLVFGVVVAAGFEARTVLGVGRVRVPVAGALVAIGVLPFVAMLLSGDAFLPGMVTSDGFTDHGPLGRGEPGLNWAMDSSLWVGWVLARGSGITGERRILYALLLASLAPLVAFRRGRGCWIGAVLVGWVLTLGPWPVGWDGRVLAEVPLPWLWLYDHFPLFHRFWWPPRAQALLYVGLVALVAVNLTDLARGLPRVGRFLPVALVFAFTVESLRTDGGLPVRSGPALTPSSAWSAVDGPAITLPVLGREAGGRYALWFQGWHRQPILQGIGGHLAGHRPPAIDAYVEANGLLRTLARLGTDPAAPEPVDPADVAALAGDGFRYVVLDRALFEPASVGVVPDRVDALLRSGLGTPVAADGRTTVWRLVAGGTR